jgi:hypothetical protein
MIYNNYLQGGSDCCNTAHLYLNGKIDSMQVFNNIFNNTSTGAGPFHMPGLWLASDTGPLILSNPTVVNNTFIGGDYTFGGNINFQIYSGTNLTFENNLVMGGNQLVCIAAAGYSGAVQTTITALDYNVYENIQAQAAAGNWFLSSTVGNTGCSPGTTYNTLAAWQTATSGEAHSQLGTAAQLNINQITGAPNFFTSLVTGSGKNLSSLGISALNIGAPQFFGPGATCGTGCLPRSSTKAWDVGAYPVIFNPPAPSFNMLVMSKESHENNSDILTTLFGN